MLDRHIIIIVYRQILHSKDVMKWPNVAATYNLLYNAAIMAVACVKCGHCESRCPFHVKQKARMEEIRRYG